MIAPELELPLQHMNFKFESSKARPAQCIAFLLFVNGCTLQIAKETIELGHQGSNESYQAESSSGAVAPQIHQTQSSSRNQNYPEIVVYRASGRVGTVTSVPMNGLERFLESRRPIQLSAEELAAAASKLLSNEGVIVVMDDYVGAKDNKENVEQIRTLWMSIDAPKPQAPVAVNGYRQTNEILIPWGTVDSAMSLSKVASPRFQGVSFSAAVEFDVDDFGNILIYDKPAAKIKKYTSNGTFIWAKDAERPEIGFFRSCTSSAEIGEPRLI